MSDVAVQLLARYTQALNANPLRTKMLTSGCLASLAEVLAGKFAGVGPASSPLPPGQVSEKRATEQQPLQMLQALFAVTGLNKRVLQMFFYGSLISAPLGHVLTGILQRAFAGKTSTRDRIAQVRVVCDEKTCDVHAYMLLITISFAAARDRQPDHSGDQ